MHDTYEVTNNLEKVAVVCDCKYTYNMQTDKWVLTNVCSNHSGILSLGHTVPNWPRKYEQTTK